MINVQYKQTEEVNSPGLGVKATLLHDQDFRVETDGVSMDVSLSTYSKVIVCLYKNLEVLCRLIYVYS